LTGSVIWDAYVMFTQQKIPNIYFFCTGKSHGETKLTSFDTALLQAGVGNTHLIKVSSIVPLACQEVKPFSISQGMLLPIAYYDDFCRCRVVVEVLN